MIVAFQIDTGFLKDMGVTFPICFAHMTRKRQIRWSFHSLV